MRTYSRVFSQFWTGDTGRRIRALGSLEAQVVALYLISCPSATMTGIYYIPLPTLAHETGIPLEGASKALRSLVELEFCEYHQPSETVWVRKRAYWQIGETLKPTDKQIAGILNLLEYYKHSVFVDKFLELYGDAYHLKKEALRRGLGGPSKPESSEQRAVNREQEREPRAPARGQPSPSRGTNLPEGWRPPPEELSLAGPGCELELEKFHDWAKANAVRKADWRATWRNWARRIPGFGPLLARTAKPPSATDRAKEIWEKANRLEAEELAKANGEAP